jgi:hypothetical protein
MEKMLSLYDYLGRAAGSKLGKQVADYAKLRKAKCSSRHVSNPAYTGEVLLYTKEFLDECFTAKKIFGPKDEDYTEINTQLIENIFEDVSKGIF